MTKFDNRRIITVYKKQLEWHSYELECHLEDIQIFLIFFSSIDSSSSQKKNFDVFGHGAGYFFFFLFVFELFNEYMSVKVFFLIW